VNCYAERMAARFSNKGQPYEGIAKMTDDGPRWTGKLMVVHDKMDQPKRWQRPRMIFVNSMSDLFWDEVPDRVVAQVMSTMRIADWHTFQILTKRPERALQFFRSTYPHIVGHGVWPNEFEHVWLGTSIENQETADRRLDVLRSTPAAVRFLSIEPMLGPIDLKGKLDGIHWVIVGGESGPGARPIHPQWVRDVRDVCIEMDVPFFFKQWGGWSEMEWDPNNPPGRRKNERYLNLAGGHGFHGAQVIRIRKTSKQKAGCELDGREWKQMPK
jgi:protein gp37